MADVRNLVNSKMLSDEINLGWSIILTHFEETIIKEFVTILFSVKIGIFPSKLGSSIVAKPDIISVHSELEWK